MKKLTRQKGRVDKMSEEAVEIATEVHQQEETVPPSTEQPSPETPTNETVTILTATVKTTTPASTTVISVPTPATPASLPKSNNLFIDLLKTLKLYS